MPPRRGSRPVSSARLAGVAALLLALGALGSASPAEARRLFVPRDHRGLQQAIDAAAPGDTVWVGPGTYRAPFVLRKRLTIVGDEGPDSTILDGGDSVRVLHIEGVRGVSLVGLTIQRGHANSGGGVHCVRDTSLQFSSCIFRKNWEGAIAAYQTNDINLIQNRFEDNEGSAIILDGATILARTCGFSRNRGYAGGAIQYRNSRSPFPLRDCRFDENRADGAMGGAIFADSSEVTISECWFKGNVAKIAGGAIAAANGSRIGVARSRFLENRANGGGAVHADQSSLNIFGSVLDLNQASLGAAIGLVSRGGSDIAPLISNNTFYKNSGSGQGSTIWAERVSPEIGKNIFVVEKDQKLFAGIGAAPRYECNLLHDPSGTALASLPSANTLVGDPLFCDGPNGDYTLRDLSPAALAPCGPIGALPKKCGSFKLAPVK